MQATEDVHYVQPTFLGGVVRCECTYEMERVVYMSVDVAHEGVGEWVFFRCTDSPSDHVTRALPLPVQMAVG